MLLLLPPLPVLCIDCSIIIIIMEDGSLLSVQTFDVFGVEGIDVGHEFEDKKKSCSMKEAFRRKLYDELPFAAEITALFMA